jgi:hypothetical protein
MTDMPYSEKAAARILNVHFDSVRRWRRKGLIRYSVSSTGRISYKLDDLLAFAMAKTVEPTAAPGITQPSDLPAAPEIVYPFNRPAVRR